MTKQSGAMPKHSRGRHHPHGDDARYCAIRVACGGQRPAKLSATELHKLTLRPAYSADKPAHLLPHQSSCRRSCLPTTQPRNGGRCMVS